LKDLAQAELFEKGNFARIRNNIAKYLFEIKELHCNNGII
jgi:hypothetical protein